MRSASSWGAFARADGPWLLLTPVRTIFTALGTGPGVPAVRAAAQPVSFDIDNWSCTQDHGISRKGTLVIFTSARGVVIAKLVILSEKGQGSSFPLNKPCVVIGRNADTSDIVLEDDGVSRPHCRILCEGDRFYIEDLGSHNGTFIGRRRIDQKEGIHEGTLIALGDTVLKFTVGGNAGATTTRSALSDSKARIIAQITQQDAGALYHPDSAELHEAGEIAAQLARLYDLAREAQSTQTEAQLWKTVQAVLGTFLPGAELSIYLRKADGALALSWATGGDAADGVFSSRTIASEVVTSRHSVLYEDLPAQGDTSKSIQSLGIRSAACAPIMSAHETYGVLEAATDSVTAPVTENHLHLISVAAAHIGLALESVRRLEAAERTSAALVNRYVLAGASGKMEAVKRRIGSLAAADCTVLIQGATGTGKEVAARAIHFCSRRADGPLVAVNCAAIPAHLTEDEFFGHEKGAFTGADALRKGRFETADSGTLFLDEIGDLPLELQPRLLRVLEDRVVERLGGGEPITVDVRVVAATNQSLSDLVKEKKFRSDLYYRLRVATLDMPSLRDHMEDLDDLVACYLDRRREESPGPAFSVSDAAMEKLRLHPWDGNVRELNNVLEGAITLATCPVIDADDIMLAPALRPDSDDRSGVFALRTLRDVQKRHIINVLKATKGNRTKAAGILGITREGLYNMIKRLGINFPPGAQQEHDEEK